MKRTRSCLLCDVTPAAGMRRNGFLRFVRLAFFVFGEPKTGWRRPDAAIMSTPEQRAMDSADAVRDQGGIVRRCGYRYKAAYFRLR
jgi:hypothetical protein